MFEFILRFALYSAGIVLGFFLTGFIVPKRELDNEKDVAEMEEIFNFPYKFIDELDEMPDTELTEEELINLKFKTTSMEIPFLSNKVIMFYDHESKSFRYYSKSDLIYKYLNVVCRKYVLEHNCKSIYVFDTMSTLTTHASQPASGPFVKKVEFSTMSKNMNQFVRIGTLEDYERSYELKPVVEMSILEFMKLKPSS